MKYFDIYFPIDPAGLVGDFPENLRPSQMKAAQPVYVDDDGVQSFGNFHIRTDVKDYRQQLLRGMVVLQSGTWVSLSEFHYKAVHLGTDATLRLLETRLSDYSDRHALALAPYIFTFANADSFGDCPISAETRLILDKHIANRDALLTFLKIIGFPHQLT